MLILTQQINFLKNSIEHMDRYTLYLSISDRRITCEPSLALRNYYRWSLKYTYNIELEDSEIFDYFFRIIEKEDYKALSKMEYSDFKSLAAAYYSLGELYFEKKEFGLAKDYFYKVITILEETLKSGNKYGHDIMKEKQDVSFFELMMWARKNIGDMLSGQEALTMYDSIVSESELLYLQKNHLIYNAAKGLNLVDRAYESARNIIKVLPDYENINKDVVEFLKNSKEYFNGLDIAISEYRRTEDEHWIKMVRELCENDSNFNIQCVEKVIQFADILLWNLKLASWSEVILKLYNTVRQWKTALIHLLNYLRKSFKKINCNNVDFSHFPQALEIIKVAYSHINNNKYENVEFREYEIDFLLYMLYAAIHNKKYCEVVESSTKLLSIANINKQGINNLEVITENKNIAYKNLVLKDQLEDMPWIYLFHKFNYSASKCEYESSLTLDELINFNPKSIENLTKNKFDNFKFKLNGEMGKVLNKIKEEEAVMGNELQTILDGIYCCKTIEEEINTNVKEFSSKIVEDLDFLMQYVDEKMKIAIPDNLESNLNIIDEFNDINSIKQLSEEKYHEGIVKWCNENLQILLSEQFNVYLAKYKNIYLEHMEIINRIEQNRETIINVYKDFANEINPIVFITPEDVSNNFLNSYNEFLNNISYEIKLLPEEKAIQAFTYGIKNVFVKAEGKIENLKKKIKTQIIENKVDISSRLKNKVFENNEELKNKLQNEIDTLFLTIAKEIINDRNSLEKYYDIIKLQYSDLKLRNEEIQVLLNFIEVEIDKYKEQIDSGAIYHNEKCFKLI